MQKELGELKQLSSRRKKDNVVISLVAASEWEGVQTQIVFRLSPTFGGISIFKQIKLGVRKIHVSESCGEKSKKLFL